MKRFACIYVWLLCLVLSVAAQEKIVKLKIVQTSDVHGNYYPYNFITRKDWQGSLARIYAFVQKEREQYKMYAIVEINGQQFKAEAGQKLFVHHIEGAENGSTVEFEKVLLVDKDGNVTVGVPTVEGAKVVCQVVSSLVKGDKVLVFHKKRRKGHRKLNGHRQQFTELTITEVVA